LPSSFLLLRLGIGGMVKLSILVVEEVSSIVVEILDESLDKSSPSLIRVSPYSSNFLGE
jgi:hypothetical protein